jgi:hypothetical protein
VWRGRCLPHECDAHLGFARLALAQHDPAAAQDHLAKARAIVEQTGYHRRDEELATLEAEAAALAKSVPPPAPAPSAPPPGTLAEPAPVATPPRSIANPTLRSHPPAGEPDPRSLAAPNVARALPLR